VASAPETLVETLQDGLAGGPALRLAMLFGSAARGRSRPDSDVDVGIVPVDADLPLRAELELQAKLERICGRPVQVVRLDQASTVLRWEAARHGIPIVSRSRAEHVRFVARAALDYAELAPALSRGAALFRERLVGTERSLKADVTDTAVVVQKLTSLNEHLMRARRRRPATAAALRADVGLQDALALSVLVAIEEAVDLAFHTVADEGWGVPSSYAEGFEMLSRHGVIDAALAQDMVAASGLRNRIAHGYASLDVDRLWREMPAGLAALERYARAIARFIPPVSS
jgi:uncharacterized protein YutE (UPF0331/DUF86 family)/predicted nucleotidyltransferase